MSNVSSVKNLNGEVFSAIQDASLTDLVNSYGESINDVSSTVKTYSGQWGGGTSVDTIPVAVVSPLVTGFSGESAYLGIESTALNLSSYVPVSSIGYNSTYISTISGKTISSYTGRYSMTANYANTADRAYRDRNYNEITSYYQPKLNIAGDAGTITAINGSAVGASIPEGWELVAGSGISIVDDAENNQTIISADSFDLTIGSGLAFENNTLYVSYETVLWSGSTTATAALTEDIRNFERVRVAFNHNGNGISEFLVSEISGGASCPLTVAPTFNNSYASVYSQSWKFPTTTSFSTAFKCKEWWGNAGAVSSKDSSNHTVVKVWGINRISGSNA